MQLSVALVTRHRTDSLRRCLASLRSQDAQPWEIVVSDDSAPDKAEPNRAAAEEFGARYITGPRRGLYANRNVAALACTGSHIRTMDDDHTFPAGHVARCLNFVDSDPDAVWTTGEISFVDGRYSQRVDAPPQLHPSGVGGPVTNFDDNWGISDGSAIYPRVIFDRGLRMVEDFGFGSSYLEFGALLKSLGFRCRVMPETWIEHYVALSDLPTRDPESCLFASLCFNLCFRPNAILAARHIAAALMRSPSLVFKLAQLRALAYKRWADARAAFSSPSIHR